MDSRRSAGARSGRRQHSQLSPTTRRPSHSHRQTRRANLSHSSCLVPFVTLPQLLRSIRHTPTASALHSSHSHSFSAPFVTLPQLLKLRHLCGTHGARLASDLSSPLRLRRLAYVRYAQRSLERVETRVSLPLASPTEEADALETPSGEARDKVYTVLSEWDDPNLETYLEKVNGVPSLRPTLPRPALAPPAPPAPPAPYPHPLPPPVTPTRYPHPYPPPLTLTLTPHPLPPTPAPHPYPHPLPPTPSPTPTPHP